MGQLPSRCVGVTPREKPGARPDADAMTHIHRNVALMSYQLSHESIGG